MTELHVEYDIPDWYRAGTIVTAPDDVVEILSGPYAQLVTPINLPASGLEHTHVEGLSAAQIAALIRQLQTAPPPPPPPISFFATILSPLLLS